MGLGFEPAETAIFALLSFIALGPAFLQGAVHSETQIAFHLLASIFLLLVAMSMFRGRGGPGRARGAASNWILAAMGLGVLVTAMQCVPLRPEWLGRLSPSALELWQLADGASPDARRATKWPLSLSPSSTQLELAKHLSCVAIYLGAASFLYAHSRARGFIFWFFAGGVVLSVIGLVAYFVGPIPALKNLLPPGDNVTATFVNKNHAGAFFLLVISAGLALVLDPSFSTMEPSPNLVGPFERLHSHSRPSWGEFAGTPAGRSRMFIALAMLGPVLALMFSHSRGAIVGLGVLGLLCGIISVDRRTKQTRTMLVAMLFPLMLCIILSAERLYSGFSTFASDDRWNVWRQILVMSHKFPWFGIGRGAFKEVYPQFQRFRFYNTFAYAEDLPLQALAEWGKPIAVAIIALTSAGLVTIAVRVRTDILRLAMLAGVVALLVQNLFDFNLEFPGTALPCCALLGLCSSRAEGDRAGFRMALGVPLTLMACFAALLIAAPAAAHTLRLDEDRLKEIMVSTEASRAEVEEITLRHPADYYVHFLAGTFYADLRDPHAMVHLGRAIELNPVSAEPHLVVGRFLCGSGRFEQGAIEYRAALERGEPVDGAILSEIQSLCGEGATVDAIPSAPLIELRAAKELSTLGRVEEAEAVLRAALVDAGTDAGSENHVAVVRELIKIAPDDPEVASWGQDLGEHAAGGADIGLAVFALEKSGHPEGAEKLLLSGLGRLPDDWILLRMHCDRLIKRSEYSEVEQRLKKFLISATDREERIGALERLATAQDELGDKSDARVNRLQARELNRLNHPEL